MSNYFRHSFILAIVFLIASGSVAATHSSFYGRNPDLEYLRELVIAELMEPQVDEAQVEHLMNTLSEDSTWPGIDYEDVSNTGFQHSRHLGNMLTLARAYKKSGTRYYQNPETKEVFDAALDFWLEHDFISDNWWHNQIGTPSRLGNVLLVMDDGLSEEQKTRAAPIVGRGDLDAWGARPGGDLIQIAAIYGKYGLFTRDLEVVEESVQAMASEIGFAVDRGDPSDVRGLHTDFSFHHRGDRVSSTITYGMGYTRSFADWAEKLAGTSLSFPDEAIELLVDYYLDGISKSMVYAKYPDPTLLNRGMTRRRALRAHGPELPEQLLKATSYRKDELEEIAGIRRGERKPDFTSNTFFWHTEYHSHQRPDYFTSVRMHSSRNHTMEVPYNSEGLKNHHLGDGANLITRTGEEYQEIFPVWDWQKIPGTTVVQKPSLPDPDQIQQKGKTGFVGGVTDGVYGAAAFDFESAHDPLSAWKSWFFFDDEFVAMGSGIRSGSAHPVTTTLNQSLLSGEVTVGSSYNRRVAGEGDHSLSGVSWVHHDETAYIFPSPTPVRLKNSENRGYWHEINDRAWSRERAEDKMDVFTLWLDHGQNPRQAGYEYIVVPNLRHTQVERYRSKSAIEILSNTPQVQAVRHNGLNITQIAFYEPGQIELPDGVIVSAETPGLVMVNVSGRSVEATVSDPSRQLDTLRLNVTTRVQALDEHSDVTWDPETGRSSVHFKLPDGEYAGQSVSAKFQL
ncbi:MAG: polysaccharide lyase family 8 super-sandwich domain-containing protein [Balneolales bacterium]